eukprot:6686713-Alexandrium_andersonii.AAC.1
MVVCAPVQARGLAGPRMHRLPIPRWPVAMAVTHRDWAGARFSEKKEGAADLREGAGSRLPAAWGPGRPDPKGGS